jgi:hypothetical protein
VYCILPSVAIYRRNNLVYNSPFSAMRCRLHSWYARYTFATWGVQDLTSIPVVLRLLCWRCCISVDRGGRRVILVFRILEVVSKISECDNNRVRQDDTAGITTDLTRLQKQNTLLTINLTCFILYVCSFDIHRFTQDFE